MPEPKPHAFANSPIRNSGRRARWAFALAVSVVLLAGCGYTRAQQACQQTVHETSTTLRVMVQFRQPVVGNAPELLGQLQNHAHGCVTYVSSVSPSVHVYAITGAADMAALRASLMQWVAVQDVVADARAMPAKAR